MSQEQALPDDVAPPQASRPVSIILAGTVPEGLDPELARRTGARVEVSPHTGKTSWNIQDLVARVKAPPRRDALVFGENADIRALKAELRARANSPRNGAQREPIAALTGLDQNNEASARELRTS